MGAIAAFAAVVAVPKTLAEFASAGGLKDAAKAKYVKT